jgi:GTP 3',8-cyclase
MLNLDFLEVNATLHCDLNCKGCNHDAPSMSPWFAKSSVVQADLEKMAAVAQVKELRIVGGEPLLHPGLFDLVSVARASGIAKEQVLFTNGLLLPRAPEALWRVIDQIILTVYPSTRGALHLEWLRKQAFKYRVKLHEIHRSHFSLQFRSSERPDQATEVFTNCDLTHGRKCYTIHEGFFYRCPQAMIMSKRRGPTYKAFPFDRVGLNAPNLEEELRKYLQSRAPLRACDWCHGTLGETIYCETEPRRG